jgi:crotonobetainyl-CoA:carnitine CoA-transferase CaiB-like acyl-CoA transferase
MRTWNLSMADRPGGALGADTTPPLAGTTVVDLSLGVAGPCAAGRLGDLGARVVKVEPLGGDPARGFGPPFVGEDAAAFVALNRGKQSVAVDLDAPDGAGLVRRLLERADVVVADLGPGRADAVGLGYDDLAARNPGLVYVAVSAWGEEGPLADLPGAELPVQALAEYLGSLGRIGEPPVRLGADVAGMNTGIFACQAALGGLVARDVSGLGRGQRVAVSMLGSLLHLRGIMWTSRSNPDEWWGFHLDHYTNPPETGYRTADGQVLFGLRRGDSEDFDQLMISLGLVEHISDPVFGGFGRDAAPLGRHSVEAKPIWEEGFADRTTEEVVDLFHERGGDAVPFTDYSLITTHAQTEAIGALCEVPLAGGGSMRGVAPVWGFSDTPPAVAGPAPRLGQHTDQLLAELGFEPSAVTALRARGVVA